jgi:predicted ATP-grasp superfamily ATP-dependent carboligase
MARACVLADLDIVRPLGRAGVRCIAVARGTDPVRWSRFTDAFADRTGWGTDDERVAGLLALAAREPEPPTLFYANDQDLLLVSRRRAALGEGFRFAIAGAELVELLLSKTRAHERFVALGLPVPPLWRLDRDAGGPPDGIGFPVVVKPVVREHGPATGGAAKATRFGTAAELEAAWPALAASADDLLAQRLIEGGEDRIESYHAYVDAAGEIAGEFCGRKLRTFPVRYGNTTALVTTDAEDVRALGRRVVQGLGLRGVAKVDFKRDPAGSLWLLEVNPRFNLWHHAGACAGVNIPALVHADLTDTARPAVRAPRAGLTWTDPLMDRRARREAGVSVPRWLAWTARADSRWSIALDDPLPVVRGIVAPFVRRRLPAAG